MIDADRLAKHMLRQVVVVALLLSAMHGAVAASTDDQLAQGEYLAKAADCGACHTAPGGKPFAGGLPIDSPVGVIYASNITPSRTAGIGNYSESDFARALRQGIRRDDANLYPAMPYTAYSYLSDADVSALYAYFLHAVAPVDERPKQTALAFPLNIRYSMKAWNLLFLNKKPFQPDDQHSAAYNRGKYLVLGAAHCTTCHTPRGFLMEEKATDEFGGAQVAAWYAPNITSDAIDGIGSWSGEQLVQYLRTGKVIGKAGAAGSMAEAVEKSFQYLTDADLRAIADYIGTIPASRHGDDQVQRSSVGRSSSKVDVLRGVRGVSADASAPTGPELFEANCTTCHSFQGNGTKDGYFPSLFHNSTVGSSNPNNLVAVILSGVNRTTVGKQAYMPGFDGGVDQVNQLTDDQVALVANFVLDSFGPPHSPVTASVVAQVREGGPRSPLVWLAQLGVALGALFVIALFSVVILRRRAKQRLSG